VVGFDLDQQCIVERPGPSVKDIAGKYVFNKLAFLTIRV
jgi:hypothetical protein